MGNVINVSAVVYHTVQPWFCSCAAFAVFLRRNVGRRAGRGSVAMIPSGCKETGELGTQDVVVLFIVFLLHVLPLSNR